MFDLDKILRPHIKGLQPYSSARDEFEGQASVMLDANENALGSVAKGAHNRYPDPHHRSLREVLSSYKGVLPEQIFMGNGSDEAIDLLFRLFCSPGRDNIIICPPTYGMYAVSASINNVGLKEIPLTIDFQLNTEAVLDAVDEQTKLIFICSPNNPTGNSIQLKDIAGLLTSFEGIVVIDEAYIDFSTEASWTKQLNEFPNLVVLQTFSKAWGMAALRLGMAFASADIIGLFYKIKPPYNVNGLSQALALQALDNKEQHDAFVATILQERSQLIQALGELTIITKIYPSAANFLLVQTTDANNIYEYLIGKGVVVRNRSNLVGCNDCLRITVGSKEENQQLIEALKQYTT